MSNELHEITYLSRLDNSMQPAFILPAEGNDPRPLAVCLHTWSFSYDSGSTDQFELACRARNWHMIYPHFRGPNWNPEGCGSDLVVSDLECAVEYMQANYNVDASRIYLVGGSGGGHASLLMAARRPELWTAVSSWCPISDIAAWYTQSKALKKDPANRGYDDHIFDACGGDPVTNPQAAAQAKHRSPITWLSNAHENVILDIGTGIHDGHRGSVPISQAILAFNEVADPADRISAEDIAYMVETEQVPAHLQFEGEDPAYGPYKVLMRRVSGKVRLTIFEGGHDLVPGPAFGFLEQQTSGNEPVWNSGDHYDALKAALSK
ncbi:MAG: hypothetical protein E7463_02395 [Ruminococcaceae bacterium]|nr:hypothetical protein [Oscillospiraceae bacterium]